MSEQPTELTKQQAEDIARDVASTKTHLRDSLYRAYKAKVWKFLDDPSVTSYEAFARERAGLRPSWAWDLVRAAKMLEELTPLAPGVDLSAVETTVVLGARSEWEDAKKDIAGLSSPTLEGVDRALRARGGEKQDPAAPRPTREEAFLALEFLPDELPPAFQAAYDAAMVLSDAVKGIAEWPQMVEGGIADLYRGHDVLVEIVQTLDGTFDRLFQVLEELQSPSDSQEDLHP